MSSGFLIFVSYKETNLFSNLGFLATICSYKFWGIVKLSISLPARGIWNPAPTLATCSNKLVLPNCILSP